jgi:hypothetical protein
MTITATKKDVRQSQWHALVVPEAARILNSDLHRGLSVADAERLHDRFGANQLVGKPGKSAWVRFLLQFNQPLLYILLAAGVVTAFLQEWIDSGVIFGVTIINAIIGFVQYTHLRRSLLSTEYYPVCPVNLRQITRSPPPDCLCTSDRHCRNPRVAMAICRVERDESVVPNSAPQLRSCGPEHSCESACHHCRQAPRSLRPDRVTVNSQVFSLICDRSQSKLETIFYLNPRE